MAKKSAKRGTAKKKRAATATAKKKPVKRRAKSCRGLDDVRAEIDRIDRVLLELIAERGSYVRRAAELKAKRRDVLDPARIAGIVAEVKKRAKTLGLDPDVVAAAFRAMIYRFVAYEFREYDRRNPKAKTGNRNRR